MYLTFYRILFLSIVFFLSSCEEKENFNYNSKANELIRQVLIDQNCNCIVENPDIMISGIPYLAIDKDYTKHKKFLDSINRQSIFILDTATLKQKNIRWYKSDKLRAAIKREN